MALDNVLKIYDEQGNPVDYDILASDVKFNDGKDLPTKLGELEQEIGEGGYTPPQGGIPKTDLSSDVQTSLGKADTAYQKPASGIPATDLADGVIPDTSNLATKTELSGKVDKVTGYGLSKNDYTDADKAAVDTIGSKANDNVVVKSISVNGGEAQTPMQGNVNINVQGVKGDDGITPQIGNNGNWWIGTTDTGVKAQGPAGTSYTSADLVIGNALNGQGDVLGMSGAMKMKDNIDLVQANLVKLYNKLANMAFWDAQDQADAEPIPNLLDWSLPKKTVTLDLSNVGSHITIKHGAAPMSDTNTIDVDQGSDLVLDVVADNGYGVASLSSTNSGVTISSDKSKLTLANVTANVTLVISATAGANPTITVANQLSNAAIIKNGNTPVANSGTIEVTYGGLLELTVEPVDEDVTLNTVTALLGSTPATVTANQDGTFTVAVANVTADATLTVGGTATFEWYTVPFDDLLDGSNNVITYGLQQGRSIYADTGTSCDGRYGGNPTVVQAPAGYDESIKVYTSDIGDSNPGKTTANFFATGGKRYLHVKITGITDTDSYDYKSAVGCYATEVIGNQQGNMTTSSITGKKGRIGYVVPNVQTSDGSLQWKRDLSAQGTGIAYVKILLSKYNKGQNSGIDSRTYINNITIKYKFTDD